MDLNILRCFRIASSLQEKPVVSISNIIIVVANEPHRHETNSIEKESHTHIMTRDRHVSVR